MRKRIRLLTAVSSCTLVAMAQSAPASLIMNQSQLPSPTLLNTFNNFNGILANIGASNQLQVGATSGTNIVATSSNAFVGQPEPFHLSANGEWDANTKSAFTGINAGTANLTFTFETGRVSGVGGFINYAPASGPDPEITALNSSGGVLESYDLATAAPISTPGGVNAGAFRGILRPQGDIAAFEISNSFIVLDDLQFTPIPEPSACVILVAGTSSALLRRRGIQRRMKRNSKREEILNGTTLN